MFLFCFHVASGKSAASCGKSGIMCLKNRQKGEPSQPKEKKRKNTETKKVSVLVTFLLLFFSFFFSRSKGRGPVFLAVICLTSGGVAGQCQVEQRNRIPPANPELNATPSLREACHEQSR